MTSVEPLPVQRQRQRRSRKKRGGNPLQGPRVGKAIFVGMVIVAAVFFVLSLREVDLAGRLYDTTGIGDTPGAVRYMLGPPQAVSGDGAGGALSWRYRLAAGGAMQVDFEPGSKRVQRVSCEDRAMVPSSCPGVLGLQLGDPETAVWYRLGEPTGQQIAGDVKLLSYDDLGVSFELMRFTVYKIVITRRPSRFSYLARAFRFMVP